MAEETIEKLQENAEEYKALPVAPRLGTVIILANQDVTKESNRVLGLVFYRHVEQVRRSVAVHNA